MTKKVLVLGGKGRIGRSVARDIRKYTAAEITITGRTKEPVREQHDHSFIVETLDLSDQEKLRQLIRGKDLVVHCAGPFHYRDGIVLKTCIEEGINYIDVSDHRSFYQKVIQYREQAQKAGVTAVLNTGIFPGISNSMVRQGVEKFDTSDTIHLSYVVAGSGGAGMTVMRTTFLGLRTPFKAYINGEWQEVLPYSKREVIEFPQPYGKTGVYWFDVPETYTFAESFPVKTVITKFGSVPDLYNHLTWITAHIFPSSWIESSKGIEFFSRVSYKMTSVTDKWSGIGVAMRAKITGEKDGKKAYYYATMVHENTAVAAGYGTGMVAQFLLEEKLHNPGIHAVEQALSTDLFQQGINSRGVEIEQNLS